MSLLQNSNAISQLGGYNLTDSIRFRQSAGAYLGRTLSTSSNRRTWTWSAWYKIGSNFANRDAMFSARSGNEQCNIYCGGVNIRVRAENSSGTTIGDIETLIRYRDPASWYHYVVVLDVTNGTTADRCRLYINGERQDVILSTSFSNTDFAINNSSLPHNIGKEGSYTDYVDGYMAEINFVDGQALDPTDFGEYDATTGVWKPKAYTGTYGTNGFYLDMSTSGSTVLDQSGNGNDWTATNMNLTTSTATTYDKMSDVPTLTDEDTSNFCTLNPIWGNATLSNGNLSFVTNSLDSNQQGTIAVDTGKWYYECTLGTYTGGVVSNIGYVTAYGRTGDYSNTSTTAFPNAILYRSNGQIYENGVGTTTVATYTTGDTIGLAYDADNNTFTAYKNGVSQGSRTNLADVPMTPSVGDGDSTWYFAGDVNFGQRPFKYTPPTGYKAINTYNLPDSTIKDGSKHFNMLPYTGNKTSNTGITGLGFEPDLVWVKDRTNAERHCLADSVRGDGKILTTIDTRAEESRTDLITSIDTDGFTVGTGDPANRLNDLFISWCWKGSDSTAVSNTDGSITSTVSANTTSGFSVVSYTGNSTAGATIGHGLGVAPSFIITKKTSNTSNWATNAPSRANPWDGALLLNSTNAYAVSSTVWNDTAPTSSVFTVGTADAVNISGETYVAYCFAEVEGFSKFGGYTGNGSTNGPFVYTGFRPAFVMIKKYSAADSWVMHDTNRSSSNQMESVLYAESTAAESTTTAYGIDCLSNGFKIRETGDDVNTSGASFIYMAFAENPFKNSLAR